MSGQAQRDLTASAIVALPLQTLMHAQFSMSKRWWGLARILQVIAMTGGLASSLLTSHGTVVQVLSLSAVVAGIVSGLVNHLSRNGRLTGEQVRRLLLYKDGLGWEISPDRERSLRRRFGWWTKRLAKNLDGSNGNYFVSVKPLGPQRLLQNLQESVFWQAELAGTMARGLGVATIVSVLVAVLTAVFALETVNDQQTASIVAKVLAVVMVLIMSMDFGFAWWAFHLQELDLHQLDKSLTMLASQLAVAESQVIHEAHEYDIIIMQAGQVPDWVYQRNRYELDELWKLRLTD